MLIQVNVKNSGDAAYLSVLDLEEFDGLYFVRTERLSDVRLIFIFLAKVCFELFIRYGYNVQIINNQMYEDFVPPGLTHYIVILLHVLVLRFEFTQYSRSTFSLHFKHFQLYRVPLPPKNKKTEQ